VHSAQLKKVGSSHSPYLEADMASLTIGTLVSNPVRDLSEPRVQLQVLTTNVKPGQPITLSWGVMPYGMFGTSSFTAVATITINGVQLYKSQPIQSQSGSFPLSGSGAGEPSVVLNPSPTDTGSRDLYSIGTGRTLALAVVVTPVQGESMTLQAATSLLNILGEAIDSSWWNWTGPEGNVDWNTSYSPAGIFTNQSQFVDLNVNLTCLQTDTYSGETSSIGGAALSDIGIGGRGGVTFASQKQNWTWVIAGGLPAVGGPGTSDRFDYVAQYSIQDSYGNSYNSVNSTPLGVTVSVSGAKLAARATAATLSSIATAALVAEAVAALGIFTLPLAGGITAAAGIAAAGAATAYAEATDPPEPDPNYNIPVRLALPVEPQEVSEVQYQALQPLFQFLNTVNTVEANLHALNPTEGKILGAQEASDVVGLKSRIADYKAFLATATDNCSGLADLASTAGGLLDDPTNLDPTDFETALRYASDHGIPQTLLSQEFSDFGFTPQGQMMVEASLTPTVLAQIAPPFTSMLTTVAGLVVQMTGYAHQASLELLTPFGA
jgi:hypothetical protein